MKELPDQRITDWRGNEYGVGDTILYPRQSGHSVEIAEGVVEMIFQSAPTYNSRPGGLTVRVTITRASRFKMYSARKHSDITIIENITKV